MNISATESPRVIGLSGYARSGKNEVARILGRYGYAERAFADPLREALHRLNPIVTDDGRTLADVRAKFDDPSSAEAWDFAKTTYPQVRELLQRLGTEVGREMFGSTFWAELGVRDIRPRDRVVFTDCRFETEAQAVRSLGGQVWRISRPGLGPVNGHASETAMDGYSFDAYVNNDGTLDDLENAVSELLKVRESA